MLKTTKWILSGGLALLLSTPVSATDFVAKEENGKAVIPVGALMCRDRASFERYQAADEYARQWLTGACYVNAQVARFNRVRELSDGTLLGKGLRGNPRVNRYIERASYEANINS